MFGEKYTMESAWTSLSPNMRERGEDMWRERDKEGIRRREWERGGDKMISLHSLHWDCLQLKVISGGGHMAMVLYTAALIFASQ